MSATPTTPSPVPKTNHAGLTVLDYRGGKTTLRAGCGHNAISERIIDAAYEMGIQPENLVKLSGIGCSSKSPAYFVNRAHGFNTVHGRMPSVAAGVSLANHKVMLLGVSGDGDTASIGVEQFIHLMRRNLPLIYIIEDNGVYGLTSTFGHGRPGRQVEDRVVNDLPPIDTCAMAIQLGATFVARSFSGDKKQLLTLMKAALAHKGTVMIDVISPCVTFNDHEGSTKSYKYLKDHDEPVQEVGFVPHFENIDVDYDPGTTTVVTMHDGSSLRLRKLEHDYDASNKRKALDIMGASHESGEVLTGVLYLNTKAPSFTDLLNLVDQPLGQLPESVVRAAKKVLDEIMAELQ